MDTAKMTILDAVTMAFGLFAGYWVVSKLFFKSPPPASPLPATASDKAPEWYEVLQVPAIATTEEIQTAYRQLISQYHPDKVELLGPELKELATRKSQEITVAYQKGMGTRGTQG